MHKRILAALLLGLGLCSGTASAAPRTTVLELFTSQGCSSCPPADRLAAQLAHDPSFIVLSLPVDYWDRLGWKDTFAKHAFTERQRAYAFMRGDRQVYTPQAVLNGTEHANGGSMMAIGASAETTTSPKLPVHVKQHGKSIDVSVEGGRPGSPAATVVLLPYIGSREVMVGRGENSGTKITYTNIVRDIVKLGSWSGAPVAFKAELSGDEPYDGVVVLVQEGTPEQPGAIIGATQVPLHERPKA
jgi:hypothetical protein